MATDEQAYEAVYEAVVRIAAHLTSAQTLDLVRLAQVLDTLAESPSDEKPEAPVLLSGADMLHVDPDQWYGDRGIGFTPSHLPRSTGARPNHTPPEVFT